MLAFILNFPYSIIGLVLGLISFPFRANFRTNPYVIILHVKKFWWVFGYMKGARAMTIGHVVLLGQELENNDLEHELIHVEQYERLPLVFPILYYIELIHKGYRDNKYEVEAYRRAGNLYKEKNGN